MIGGPGNPFKVGNSLGQKANWIYFGGYAKLLTRTQVFWIIIKNIEETPLCRQNKVSARVLKELKIFR
jgi:hypothetical protein